MTSHGLALLYLARCYRRTRDPELERAVRFAARFTLSAQNERGGWRYYPLCPDVDVIETSIQVIALRAVRAAGIAFDEGRLERAERCVRALL